MPRRLADADEPNATRDSERAGSASDRRAAGLMAGATDTLRNCPQPCGHAFPEFQPAACPLDDRAERRQQEQALAVLEQLIPHADAPARRAANSCRSGANRVNARIPTAIGQSLRAMARNVRNVAREWRVSINIPQFPKQQRASGPTFND